MRTETRTATGFWKTLFLLLRVARQRANGRRRRQRELLAQRTGRQVSTDWSVLGIVLPLLFMVALQAIATLVLSRSIDEAQIVNQEMRGHIVVDGWFYAEVSRQQAIAAWQHQHPEEPVLQSSEPAYANEAHQLTRQSGSHSSSSAAEIEKQLRDAVAAHGVAALMPERGASPGIRSIGLTGPYPLMIGSLVLLWWLVMLVFQGEGLELDIQRRRHPLWEWLFSHPVSQSAVFLAEVLTPIAANPAYWAAPLLPGILYAMIYGWPLGLLAALLIGVPVTLAAGTLGKAMEIAILLRFSPRTRGGIIGLMSWIGYSSLLSFFVGMSVVPWLLQNFGRTIAPLAALRLPLLQIFLGGPWPLHHAHTLSPHGRTPLGFSFLTGVLGCWLISAVVAACGVGFSVWGAQRGLAGAAVDTVPARSRKAIARGTARFGRDPLYRKELLWFIRDRSALVQAILIPLTIAGYQLFNLRGLLSKAGAEWNYTCGAAIFFGTYFLWILGPKSLASEGQALWIALAWPRGLDDLLKTKARLWSFISCCMVFPILLWAALHFHADAPQIALLAVGWWFFARSMAEKSVTLVTVTDSGGQPQPQRSSRRYGAQLGMLTFALGVVTRQWHIAVLGIVFSWITAAAMWQNFRARLPYLYDPWSEKLPPPPTLMHAMIGISLMVEGSAVFMAIAAAAFPKPYMAAAPAMGYAISSTLVFLLISRFFHRRGVIPNQIWSWVEGSPAIPRHEQSLEAYLAEPSYSFAERYGFAGKGLWQALLLALLIGAALGGLGTLYTMALAHIPALAERLRASHNILAGTPGLRLSYAIMAVGFAPFAEEYLFRGLLFRALDREWGGWRALLGAAAFFTVYHPMLAWPAVFTVGLANCLLFKRTRRLLPCIVVHMTYNAIVLLR